MAAISPDVNVGIFAQTADEDRVVNTVIGKYIWVRCKGFFSSFFANFCDFVIFVMHYEYACMPINFVHCKSWHYQCLAIKVRYTTVPSYIFFIVRSTLFSTPTIPGKHCTILEPRNIRIDELLCHSEAWIDRACSNKKLEIMSGFDF